MLIIADHRLPVEAKSNLGKEGKLLKFETTGIVYESISGHPDIFMCQTPENLIVSPDIPLNVVEALEQHSILFTFGSKNTGNKHPETIHYNAVATSDFLIHNLNYTDESLLNKYDASCRIHVTQGYTRCNLLYLGNKNFITSDKGIYKKIAPLGNVLYVSPKGIQLEKYSHGFIGGTAGILNNRVLFAGSLKHFPEGYKITQFLKKLNYEVVELYDGPLVDGGGIFFLQ